MCTVLFLSLKFTKHSLSNAISFIYQYTRKFELTCKCGSHYQKHTEAERAAGAEYTHGPSKLYKHIVSTQFITYTYQQPTYCIDRHTLINSQHNCFNRHTLINSQHNCFNRHTLINSQHNCFNRHTLINSQHIVSTDIHLSTANKVLN